MDTRATQGGQKAHRHGPDALDKAELRRKAILAFMTAHQLKPAVWARQAGLPNANALYNLVNGHSMSLSQGTLEKLAQAAGTSVAEIFGERKSVQRQAAVLHVQVEAASGAWRNSYEVPGKSTDMLPIPPGVAVDEAARITDNHAAQIYHPGTLIGVRSVAALGKRGLRHGDKVLVDRIREGRHEVTIRKVVDNGSQASPKVSLVYLSDLPIHGSTVSVPCWPYEGQFWQVEGDTFQIRGRVILGLLIDE